MSNQSNIFGKPLAWESVFTNVFRNVFEADRSSYSVLGFEPNLVLDFDDEYYRVSGFQRPFATAVTHTRASTATYSDSTGTLQTAASGVARIGHHVYNGSAWVNEGLLHESEARTNLLTYSEDLSDVAWTKAAGVSIGSPITRKGISLDSIENAGTVNIRDVKQSIGSVANGAYVTASVFVEAGTSTQTSLRFDDGTASNRCAIIIAWSSGVPSIQTSAAVGLTFVLASIENFADGLYRISMTTLNNTGGALTLDARYFVQWTDPAAAVNTYAGGFQAEIGSSPSSYIPTSAAAVARAADVLTVPAANLPWNPVVVSIQMDGKINYSDEGVAAQQTFLRWQADANNYISVDLDTDSTATGEVNFNQAASGTADTVATTGTALAPSTATAFNIASRHGSTFINGALGGTALTADTTPVALANLSSANLNLGFDYMGTIRNFRIWSQDITDAGLVGATA